MGCSRLKCSRGADLFLGLRFPHRQGFWFGSSHGQPRHPWALLVSDDLWRVAGWDVSQRGGHERRHRWNYDPREALACDCFRWRCEGYWDILSSEKTWCSKMSQEVGLQESGRWCHGASVGHQGRSAGVGMEGRAITRSEGCRDQVQRTRRKSSLGMSMVWGVTCDKFKANHFWVLLFTHKFVHQTSIFLNMNYCFRQLRWRKNVYAAAKEGQTLHVFYFEGSLEFLADLALCDSSNFKTENQITHTMTYLRYNGYPTSFSRNVLPYSGFVRR